MGRSRRLRLGRGVWSAPSEENEFFRLKLRVLVNSEQYFWVTVCKTVRPMRSDRVCPVLPCQSVTYYGQTVGSIKMKLFVQVGLGPGHIVLDGEPPLPPRKGHMPHNYGPYVLWSNDWMHQDATWYGGRPQPMRLC